jgi:hypothetical protein
VPLHVERSQAVYALKGKSSFKLCSIANAIFVKREDLRSHICGGSCIGVQSVFAAYRIKAALQELQVLRF